MIDAIISRLEAVDGYDVREGFYTQSLASKSKFIFVQPHQDSAEIPSGKNPYKEELRLQLVVGVKLTATVKPTAELINAVRQIRSAFFNGERDPAKPSWLTNVISFTEPEPCKYIMPEAHEKHGLAVITLSITQTVKFGDLL